MRPGGCLFLAAGIVLALLLPFVFANIFTTALLKLHLGPGAALLVMAGILAGSVVNIPVKRIVRSEVVLDDPLSVFGLSGVWPGFRRLRNETVVAVNVGGCIVPSGLAVYQIAHIAGEGAPALTALLLAVLVNTVVCYSFARPIPNLGIAIPTLIPPLVAALSALLLYPEQAVPIAFVAGVAGPLVGADLLHLKEVERMHTGVVSIGGAGTFDGIVLSGVVAAYLA